MLFPSEPGAREKFDALLPAVTPWDEGDGKIMLMFTWTTACDYVDSGGDSKVIESNCGSLGAWESAAGKVVDWIFSRGIDALPLWEAFLLIVYRLDGDDIPLKQISRMFNRAIVVSRQIDPMFQRPSAQAPVERSRVMNKSQAAHYLNGGHDHSNPTVFLNGLYDKGIVKRPVGSGQTLRWAVEDFPAEFRDNVR